MQDLKQAIIDTPFVILDVETTGLYPPNDRIIDISMIRWQNRTITGDFGTLVNPGRRIPREATNIHGISDSDVVGAPPFSMIAVEVQNFISGAVIVAHNADFDTRFINSELARAGYEQWDGVMICTLTMARKMHREKHNTLGDVARRLGVQTEGEHTAIGDTIATLGIFSAMLTNLQAMHYQTIEQLLRAQGGMKRAPKVNIVGRAVRPQL